MAHEQLIKDLEADLDAQDKYLKDPELLHQVGKFLPTPTSLLRRGLIYAGKHPSAKTDELVARAYRAIEPIFTSPDSPESMAICDASGLPLESIKGGVRNNMYDYVPGIPKEAWASLPAWSKIAPEFIKTYTAGGGGPLGRYISYMPKTMAKECIDHYLENIKDSSIEFHLNRLTDLANREAGSNANDLGNALLDRVSERFAKERQSEPAEEGGGYPTSLETLLHHLGRLHNGGGEFAGDSPQFKGFIDRIPQILDKAHQQALAAKVVQPTDLVSSSTRVGSPFITPDMANRELKYLRTLPPVAVRRLGLSWHLMPGADPKLKDDLIEHTLSDGDTTSSAPFSYAIQHISDPQLLEKIAEKAIKVAAVDPYLPNRIRIHDGILKHPEVSDALAEKVFKLKIPEGDLSDTPQEFADHFGNVAAHNPKKLGPIAAKVLKEHFSEYYRDDPEQLDDAHDVVDKYFRNMNPEPTLIRAGTAKARKMRDTMDELGHTKVHHKRLPPGDWERYKNKHGEVERDLIQHHIDSSPATEVLLTEGEWSGDQRHDRRSSKVLHFNVSEAQEAELRKRKLWGHFVKAHGALSAGHPSDKHQKTFGWVRWTPADGDGREHFVDEIQTDLDHKHLGGYIPKEAVDGIRDVLFGGLHPGEFMHEGWLQHMRENGHADETYGIHHTSTKGPLSRLDMNKPVPVHFHETYSNVPKKMGMSPGTYAQSQLNSDRVPGDAKIYQGKVRKTEEDFVEFLVKSLASEERESNTVDQLGFEVAIIDLIDVAKFLTGKDLSLDEVRQAIMDVDGDPTDGVLKAYGLDTPAGRAAFKGAKNLIMRKSESFLEHPKSIQHVAGVDLAKRLMDGYRHGDVSPVTLAGKHAGGAFIASLQDHSWLLKPGSGKLSPAAGISQTKASQSRREVAFSALADLLDVEEVNPSSLLAIDGHEIAAIQMWPLDWQNLHKAAGLDKSLSIRVLTPYLDRGTLHKWAVMDLIGGSVDRHGNNIMVGPDGHIGLIDHGSTFAGDDFDPAHDLNTFVPYYLRVWHGSGFSELEPEEKKGRMPVAGKEADAEIRRWVQTIKEADIRKTISPFGIDPEPIIKRLKKVLDGIQDENFSRHINSLWVEI